MLTQPYTMVLGVPWTYLPSQPKPVQKQPVRRNSHLNWTAEEDDIIRRDFPRKDTAEIAKALGRTTKQISSRANHFGVYKDKDVKNRLAREKATRYNQNKGKLHD